MDINNDSIAFSIKNVLKESYIIYVNNFKMLMKISFMIFGVKILSSCITTLSFIGTGTMWDLLILLFSFDMMLLSMFFHIKLSTTMILFISKRYKNIETNIRYNYIESKDLVWKYIRALLVYLLIILVPLFLVMLPFMLAVQGYIKWILIIIGVVLLIWFNTYYSLAPIIRVLVPEERKYMKYSRIIVRESFWKVLVLVMITFVPFLPDTIYRYYIVGYGNMSNIHNFIVSSLNSIILLFTSPFMYTIFVLTYYKLLKKQSLLKL